MYVGSTQFRSVSCPCDDSIFKIGRIWNSKKPKISELLKHISTANLAAKFCIVQPKILELLKRKLMTKANVAANCSGIKPRIFFFGERLKRPLKKWWVTLKISGKLQICHDYLPM